MREPTDKPGSVLNSHSSGTHVTVRLERPTRKPARAAPCRTRGAARSPIWSCSGWGLPCRLVYTRRGALLPHLFTLTPRRVVRRGGIFSVALSVGSRPPGVTWHPALWSPDFPPRRHDPGHGHPRRLSGRLPQTKSVHQGRRLQGRIFRGGFAAKRPAAPPRRRGNDPGVVPRDPVVTACVCVRGLRPGPWLCAGEAPLRRGCSGSRRKFSRRA